LSAMAEEIKQEQITKPEDEELEELAEIPEEETEITEASEVQTAAEIEEAPVVDEEAKPKRKKKEEEIVEERFYTIPLQKALVRPPKKRAPRAMQLLKIFVTKHMKLEMKVSEEEEEEELPQLIVSQEVNEKIWGRGIEKPPRKIKVRITKDKDGNVTVYLAETQ
jgi:large subunit ribosomal protein L31e